MPGTSWLKAPRTPVFKAAIHRAQRFVHGSWLTPMEAGLAFLHWVRQGLDKAGREKQLLLNLTDGSFDVLDFWRDLPEWTVLAVRTARNRRLYLLVGKTHRSRSSYQLWSLSSPSLRLVTQRNNLAETGSPCTWQVDPGEVPGSESFCE